MIVNYTEKGWEIVSQRAHGLLAATIAHHFNHKVRSHRWIETLVAIAEHDDAQVELEKEDLLTPQGGPVDFRMRKITLAHCERTITEAYNKSLYIGLLASMHLDNLCSGDGSDAAVKKFMKEQEKQRAEWKKSIGITDAQAKKDYRFLEWCDALSLLICQRDDQPEHRSIEIGTGPDGKTHELIALNEDTLTVEPWPFHEDSFELYYEIRTIPQLRFESIGSFKKAFQESTVSIKKWSVVNKKN